ncbi:hypothetical protein HK096_001696, partial [Nowakowskiella sp. JEL0078]
MISIDLYSTDPDQDSTLEISDDQSSLSRSGDSEDDLSELTDNVRDYSDEGECIKMQINKSMEIGNIPDTVKCIEIDSNLALKTINLQDDILIHHNISDTHSNAFINIPNYCKPVNPLSASNTKTMAIENLFSKSDFSIL